LDCQRGVCNQCFLQSQKSHQSHQIIDATQEFQRINDLLWHKNPNSAVQQHLKHLESSMQNVLQAMMTLKQ
jgi:DNA-binding FadR family transcriptional regulator